MALAFKTGDPTRDKILGKIANMRFKDLQSAIIQRGMPFEDVVSGTFPSHSSWLLKNWSNKPEKSLLKEFDTWMDRLLKQRGYKKSSPERQFKKFEPEYSQQEAIEERARNAKPKVEKPKKEKKKKDVKFGIFEGTKKEYTYKLSQKVYDKFFPKYKDTNRLVKKFSVQLTNKVKAKFPEANEKSVKIWMKRALDTIHETSKNKTK
jgi:hypothetical protein